MNGNNDRLLGMDVTKHAEGEAPALSVRTQAKPGKVRGKFPAKQAGIQAEEAAVPRAEKADVWVQQRDLIEAPIQQPEREMQHE